MTRINDNGIEREMTREEQDAYDAWAITAQAEQAALEHAALNEANNIKSARMKLKALGLTDDEIAALVGN